MLGRKALETMQTLEKLYNEAQAALHAGRHARAHAILKRSAAELEAIGAALGQAGRVPGQSEVFYTRQLTGEDVCPQALARARERLNTLVDDAPPKKSHFVQS